MGRDRQVKLIVAAVALAAGSLGLAAHAFATAGDNERAPRVSNQCDLPLEQRTGGWFCHTP